MNGNIAKRMKDALCFELDHLNFRPQVIVMSPNFHEALEKPSDVKGINVVVDDRADKHWVLKV